MTDLPVQRTADEMAYVATCQGGTGGPCTQPDCEKCWPYRDSEGEGFAFNQWFLAKMVQNSEPNMANDTVIRTEDEQDEPGVLGAGGGLPPMPTQQDREQAWRSLYVARIVAIAGVSEEAATATFKACGLGPDGYDIEDDPEQCADDEMSYWDDDGE